MTALPDMTATAAFMIKPTASTIKDVNNIRLVLGAATTGFFIFFEAPVYPDYKLLMHRNAKTSQFACL
jgi:hypothetical protein